MYTAHFRRNYVAFQAIVQFARDSAETNYRQNQVTLDKDKEGSFHHREFEILSSQRKGPQNLIPTKIREHW